jgi:two-component sensor histidine kinase
VNVKSIYGTTVTVEKGVGDISLDMESMEDVLLTPRTAIELGMILVAAALDVMGEEK